MKTILVSTDYSDAANDAVNFAAQLASECNAELILFNVYSPSVHVKNSLTSSNSLENMRRQNEEELKTISFV